MIDEQREFIARFISDRVEYIKKCRQTFDVATIDQAAEQLYKDLLNTTNHATACQHVEDALRYLAFFLADSALHSQAMHVGTLLNRYRTIGRKHLKMVSSYVWKSIIGFISGYMHKPSRVLLLAGILLLVFTGFYYLFWLLSGNPAIIDSRGKDVSWYYYPYFSIITLTTVGYGDMKPNTSIGALGSIPAYLACIEALAGYIVLGLFVSVMIIRLRTHPYARIDNWLNEYADQVLKGSHEPIFYDLNWKGYDMKDPEIDEPKQSESTSGITML